MTDGSDTLRDDPLIGRVLENRYEVRAPLGTGGMGAVYRGWQRSVDREVAIKVIDHKLAGKRDAVKRFLREARLASRLSAPSIVGVYDFGQTDDGVLYIVMELLRGHTLAQELEAGAVGLARTIHIGLQLCDALEAAHTAGIIHRDLKPGNVVILDDPPGRGLVKVLDFGLAKSLVDDGISLVTHSAALIGTPLYMSPEQIQGQPSDQRADLYSLGCMLHEMASGTSPFGAKTIDRILSNHIYEMSAPLPAEVSPALAALIRRTIAKDPGERPHTAAEVRDALLAIRTEVAAPPGRRRRWWIGGVAAVGIGAIVTAVVLVVSNGRGAGEVGSAVETHDDARLDRPAASPLSDAAERTVPDAAERAAIVDADRTAAAIDAADRTPAIDAGTATPIDAARRPTPIDAARRPTPIDAAVVRPSVDAARVSPAPVDAGDELQFYRTDASR